MAYYVGLDVSVKETSICIMMTRALLRREQISQQIRI